MTDMNEDHGLTKGRQELERENVTRHVMCHLTFMCALFIFVLFCSIIFSQILLFISTLYLNLAKHTVLNKVLQKNNFYVLALQEILVEHTETSTRGSTLIYILLTCCRVVSL